jgi:cell division transport system ATP-binding protein
MIRMAHVTKTYPGQIVLKDITLDISSGEFAFIHGPSAAGRTTLFRILTGSEKPTSGQVIVHGIDLTRQPKKIHEVRRLMGIVFQDLKLLKDRTVDENVGFPLLVTGHPKAQVSTRVREVLQMMDLYGRGNDRVHALSIGEQQRVAIARALVNDPRLLVLDEPTGNLDAQVIRRTMEIFTELHRKGKTIVFATHNAELMTRYPHRVIWISGGRGVDEKETEVSRLAT